jgi:hypothetical protein
VDTTGKVKPNKGKLFVPLRKDCNPEASDDFLYLVLYVQDDDNIQNMS